MNDRVKTLLVYIAKCVLGVVIVYTVSTLINYKTFGWALISVILVLSPNGEDSMTLAFTRIKANLVGASVGILCLLVSPNNVWI